MADSRIQLIAFDIGGVLARVDRRVDQSFFEGDVFDLFTTGLISSSDYFKRVALRTQKDVAQLEREFQRMVRPIDHLDELLKSLTRPFTLWSNINQSHFAYLLKCSAALGNYDALFAGLSFQLNLKKPDAKFYRACLEGERLSPSEILFFDDDCRNVEAAHRSGIHAHQVTAHHSMISKLKGESLLA